MLYRSFRTVVTAVLLPVFPAVGICTGEPADVEQAPAETRGGWRKYEHNPVLGGSLGTCFDVALLKLADEYWMYFSWRPKQSVALVKSKDAVQWDQPRIVLGPNRDTKWEDKINRPAVVRHGGKFHMWYTGQAGGSSIGYAASDDGVAFRRMSREPVLRPEQPWEKGALMCPHVIWDEAEQHYRMWYSGGEQYEPDAIGYATSRDGLHWQKHPANPVFRPDRAAPWERAKVTGCQVVKHGPWHVMFYIGFEHQHLARIGIARSRDGLTGWQRHSANPIIFPVEGKWDGASCYKPFALFEPGKDRWLLWYNGRSHGEQIGLAIHDGEDLGFEAVDASAAVIQRAN